MKILSHRQLKWGIIPLIFILTLLFSLCQPFPVSGETTPSEKDDNQQLINLETSIDQAVLREEEALGKYKKELSTAKEQERIYKSELSSLKVQYSVYSNLVIMADTVVKNLEQAFTGNLAVLDAIDNVLPDLKAKKDRIKNNLVQTEEQIRLNTEQQKELTADKKKSQGDSENVVKKLKELLKILKNKKDVLSKLLDIYQSYFDQYSAIEKEFSVLSQTFDREIKNRKKQDLFQRKKNAFFTKKKADIVHDMKMLLTLPKTLFLKVYWGNTMTGRESSPDYSNYVIVALLFLFLQYMLFKLFKGLLYLKRKTGLENMVWTQRVLELSERSLFLGGNILFLVLFDTIMHVSLKFPLVDLIKQALTILLLTRWALDYLKFYPGEESGFPSPALLKRLKRAVRLIRYFSLVYIFISFGVDAEHSLLPMLRLGFALLWCVEIYRLKNVLLPSVDASGLTLRLKNAIRVLPTFGYVFLFFGMIVDLYGYALIAIYVSIAMGKTFLVFILSGMIFKVLMEFKKNGTHEIEEKKDEIGYSTLNMRWFFSLLAGLIWFFLSFSGLIYIWGGKQGVVHWVFTWYVAPVKIGNMSFSLKGFTIAVIFLMLTHLLAKAWRELFQKKLLNDSGMDIGVRESITTISVYLIWTVGILLTLNVFGLNMTSITVVLGALGVGIGFGLQNIFNNFLSGIILLFERPIQVGDDVEVNGVWANVRKINVRSTVVQTYDNATVIIPNSDFISAQVTNWSFKDKRIRRNILVGVAYGSDTELVRDSLIEAAENTQRVLKYPKPEVLFKDFGDNSLLFNLRLWTRVEYYLAVESAVRFEIDRLFRERNIEISFPQRDIHIRSFDNDVVFKHASVSEKPEADQAPEKDDPDEEKP